MRLLPLAPAALPIMLLSLSASAQTTWHVDDDGPGDPAPGNPDSSDPLEDGSATHPFDAIQEAIDASADGDEVVVRDGTYTGLGNRFMNFGGRLITVRSSSGNPAACTIDLENTASGFRFWSGETSLAVVQDLGFTNGDADDNWGGAVYIDGASPTITGCRFESCAADFGGGAVASLFGAPILSGCEFVQCSTASNGGAVYVFDSNASIDNCTFTACAATDGGAIACDGGTTAIASSVFTNGTAGCGGAIYGNGTLQVDHCDFLSCVVELDGGAIHWTGDLTASYCPFQHNVAGSGGGVYFLDGSAQYDACSFFDNRANSGTGGGVHQRTLQDCSFDASTFTLNLAAAAGGGLHNEGMAESGTTTITGCSFVLNETTWDFVGIGGGVNNESTAIVLDGCQINLNAAPDVGGGMNNDGGSVTITDTSFTGNTAFHGAGLNSKADANDVTGRVDLFTSTFAGNTSDENGGGVNVHSGAVQAVDCIFEDNHAFGGDGGGLMADPGTEVLLDRCEFATNFANTDGGGAYLLGVNLPLVRDCSFRANQAFESHGGGLFIGDGPGTVTGCRFEDNYGPQGGGLAYVHYSPAPYELHVLASRFIDNSSSEGGGAFLRNADARLDNCVFSLNDAGDGCAIYATDGQVTVSNCTTYYNCGAGGGGSVYIHSGVDFIAVNSIFWGIGSDELRGFGSYELTYCDIAGGYAGVGNIDADPQLVDSSGPNGPRLSSGSPCIDAGDNTGVPLGMTTDFAGDDRFVDDPDTIDTGNGDAPVVDMGAFEFQVDAPCPADLDGTGAVDFQDLIILLASWGAPGGDVDGNATTDFQDLVLLLAAWGPCG